MSESLRDLRKASEKTLAEVARALHVTIQTVCRYENGKRRLNIDQVIPLARLYHVSAEDIIAAQAISEAVGKSE